MDPIAAIATISTARPATPIATDFIWKAVAGCWLVAGWLLVGCWLPDGDGPSNRQQPATSKFTCQKSYPIQTAKRGLRKLELPPCVANSTSSQSLLNSVRHA